MQQKAHQRPKNIHQIAFFNKKLANFPDPRPPTTLCDLMKVYLKRTLTFLLPFNASYSSTTKLIQQYYLHLKGLEDELRIFEMQLFGTDLLQ